jgi:hypothetical protein
MKCSSEHVLHTEISGKPNLESINSLLGLLILQHGQVKLVAVMGRVDCFAMVAPQTTVAQGVWGLYFVFF